jgi:uncharacterized protein involved in exopolysaccharide biosynthesis
MTPRKSVVGMLANSRLLGNAARRRIILAVLLCVLAVASVFPRQYRAASTLAPTDPAMMGLGGALGQLGAMSNVFGAQAAVELSLRIARSQDVRKIVAQKLKIRERENLGSDEATDRWLDREVDVRSLRGGVLVIETQNADPEYGKQLVRAFADATRKRLGEINRNQTSYKREILSQLVRDAGKRLSDAQNAYDSFRLRTGFTQPAASIEALGMRIPDLQAQIRAKEIQLGVTRKFATDDNMSVRQIMAELDVLRQQLAEAEAVSPKVEESVGRVVKESTKAQDLLRELMIARTLFDSYVRFLEGTSVEDLTSTGNLRELEPPFVDSHWQIKTIPAGLFLILLLAGLAIEFYGVRPPVGAMRDGE